MAIILDADVIIKGEKGNFALIGWLNAQTGQDLEIAAITIAELWHGIERATAPHRAKRERYLRTMSTGWK
jgi:predicted nucleic acid-binding protein